MHFIMNHELQYFFCAFAQKLKFMMQSIKIISNNNNFTFRPVSDIPTGLNESFLEF